MKIGVFKSNRLPILLLFSFLSQCFTLIPSSNLRSCEQKLPSTFLRLRCKGDQLDGKFSYQLCSGKRIAQFISVALLTFGKPSYGFSSEMSQWTQASTDLDNFPPSSHLFKKLPPASDFSSMLLSDSILQQSYQPQSVLSTPTIQSSEQQTIQLFERATASVVYINTFVEQINVFSMNVMEVPAGTGSGFIWDKDGHIVTNYHVIRNAAAAKVALIGPDGVSVTYPAKVQGVDPDKDIAVLSIDTSDNRLKNSLQPVVLGSCASLRVGQAALAIGNPFGLDHTLTTGVISGLGREVRSPSNRPISNVIQTGMEAIYCHWDKYKLFLIPLIIHSYLCSDAAINPGNSGGPLLDSSGRLIGMNTAIYSPSGASAGIGFAIPVDTLQYVVNALIRDGRVVRPVIGISYLETSQARILGIEQGVLVLDVPPNSPASKAGLQGTSTDRYGVVSLGDIIIAVDDDQVASEADLFKALEKYKVGDYVTLTVLRSDSKSSRVDENSGMKKFNTEVVKVRLQLSEKKSD